MALKYRRLSTTGDYNFGNNLNDFLIDREAVGQAIKTRMELLKGEWWEDLNDGLPLFQSILGQFGNKKVADLLISKRISETKDVLSLNVFESSLNPETREYSYYASSVDTVYGTISAQGII